MNLASKNVTCSVINVRLLVHYERQGDVDWSLWKRDWLQKGRSLSEEWRTSWCWSILLDMTSRISFLLLEFGKEWQKNRKKKKERLTKKEELKGEGENEVGEEELVKKKKRFVICFWSKRSFICNSHKACFLDRWKFVYGNPNWSLQLNNWPLREWWCHFLIRGESKVNLWLFGDGFWKFNI